MKMGKGYSVPFLGWILGFNISVTKLQRCCFYSKVLRSVAGERLGRKKI